jgi:dTDP-4-dehydrorhamnose reductase
MRAAGSRPIELWGGVECTVNRVGDRYHDQLELTGHADRPADLERIAALGISRLRYPVVWERVARRGLRQADWRWVDDRLTRLRSLGVAPIAGLVHHGSGPPYATLLEEHFPRRLARYAAAVAARYPWIDAYTPVNEPLTTARFCGLYGHWYPHARTDDAFVRVLLHECRATTLAMREVRRINPAARLVLTDDAGRTYSTATLGYQADFQNERRWLAWDLVAGRVDAGHPLWDYLRAAGATERELRWFLDNPCRIDVVGLNYYVTSDRFLDHRIDEYPRHLVGGNARHAYADVEAVRAYGQIAGHDRVLLEAWDRYRVPVALTETHLGCSREEQLRWLLQAWRGAQRARNLGADVRAVTAWALFGLTDWDHLVTRVSGHYEPGAFDTRSVEPRPTALSQLVKDLARNRRPRSAAARGRGWWRTRTFEPRIRRRGRPILILGAGTLGTALSRLCESRSLPHVLLRHRDLDIVDSSAVALALDSVRPWAVINTTGYVRVDEAERAEDQCRRVNTTGAHVLAEASSQKRTRFVTVSSDLVFNGESHRPYVESDATQPLSVYGRTKAEAERLVLESCAQALVIRTSAFFGPWDQWNTVHLALETLSAGQPWTAAADVRVSPTYVPDLGNAALDLLIDGETGIWHLANQGDVSWAEFVRMAATRAGYSADLVVARPVADLGFLARRPAYSVLGSARGQVLRPLDEALDGFMAEREASATVRQ